MIGGVRNKRTLREQTDLCVHVVCLYWSQGFFLLFVCFAALSDAVLKIWILHNDPVTLQSRIHIFFHAVQVLSFRGLPCFCRRRVCRTFCAMKAGSFSIRPELRFCEDFYNCLLLLTQIEDSQVVHRKANWIKNWRSACSRNVTKASCASWSCSCFSKE